MAARFAICASCPACRECRALKAWIEVGLPEAARLHKAAKMAERVCVYPTRDAQSWLARLAGERIHRAEHIEVQVIDTVVLASLAARLERRMDFDLSVSEQSLYVSSGTETLTGAVQRVSLVY